MTKETKVETPSGGVIQGIKFNPPIPPSGAKGHSLIKYLAGTEWAILPEKLTQIEDVVTQFINGTNVALAGEPQAMSRRGNVAVIPISGTIAKKAYGLDALSGVRTATDIRNDIQEAIDNSSVSGIVLSIDSPGGTVDGTKELADYIAKATKIKPIVSYADGTMASAAYWIGSSASQVVAFDTAKVGSVGVVVSHQDISKAEEAAGIKTTYIYQGKYKVAGNSSTALDPQSIEYIQSHVDTYYSMFVDVVANNRGIDREKVISDIASGAVFIGKAALELNLVDSIGSLDDAINLALTLGEEKMTDEKMHAQLDTLTVNMAKMADQLETAQAANTKLQADLDAKQLAEEARNKADAAKLHLASVTEQCEGCGLSEETVASFATLDNTSFAIVLAEVKGRQTKLDEALAQFTTQTDGATTIAPVVTGITSIDAAVEMIEKRDRCDVGAATKTAQVEYPKLFKSN
jgi:signal peptide peptidase SppA